MSLYFNDNDPTAAAWLRELYPSAVVDERSITDVQPDDLVGYTRAHFFGGIGGWQYALDLAGWPAEREVWTGSCPCQPFSAAGKAAGLGDDRHLWPAFRHLISERRPAVCFGEQVASKDGRWWLAGVRADLEALGYAVGAADLCAASVGAPHIRQRLYWVAHATGQRHQGRECAALQGRPEPQWPAVQLAGRGDASRLADTQRDDGRADEPGRRPPGRGAAGRVGTGAGGVGDTMRGGCRNDEPWRSGDEPTPASPWSDARLIQCADGRWRRISPEPALFPLSPRLPGRVGLLRGAGNSIVAPLAAQFIQAFLEATTGY